MNKLAIATYTLSGGFRFRTFVGAVLGTGGVRFKKCSQNGHFQKHKLLCNFANFTNNDGKICQINQYLRTESIVIVVSAIVVIYCYLSGVKVRGRGVRRRHVPLTVIC